MQKLFRDDVFTSKRLDWLGPSRIAVPPSQKLLASAAFIMSLAVLLILFLAQYQRKAHIRGVLAISYPLMEIYAPERGRISQVLLSKGDIVIKGQPVLYLEIDNTLKQVVRNYALLSPNDGVVDSIAAIPGYQVQTGQRLAAIETIGSNLVAEFPMQGKDVGYLKSGDRVVLRYEDFPYQKFGLFYGTVKLLTINQSEVSGAPPYMLKVALETKEITAAGRKIPLTKGLIVDTDIALEKRNLIGWIFDKAN